MQIIREDKELRAAHYDNVDAWRPKARVKRTALKRSKIVISRPHPSSGRPVILMRTDHLSFLKKLKKGIQNAAYKLSKTGLNPVVAIRKTANVVKKVTVAATLLPLLPLKGAMVKALKKQGVAVPGKFEDIIRLFASKILGKHYEETPAYYESRDNFLPIAALIPPIIGFFKQLLAHKKAGAKLTPTEKVMADEATNVIDDITAKMGGASGDPNGGSNSKDNTGGDPNPMRHADGTINFKSPMVMGAIAGVIVLFFILMRK